MPLREMLHDGLDMVAIVGPVSPDVLAALPDALAAHAASPAGRALRRRPTSGQRWGRRPVRGIEALARRCVVVHPERLGPADLALAAQRDGYRGLPVAIHVSGETLAVMLPHDLFDGAGGWDDLEQVFLHATGAPLPGPRRVVRNPVLASVRKAGLLDREELARARRARRAAARDSETDPQVAEPLTVSPERRSAGLHDVWLAPAEVQRLRDRLEPGDPATGRPGQTLSMALAGLALDAAGQAIAPEHDLRVRMSVDLRRYGPPDRRVHGPFSTSFPFGTLRTVDTRPEALGSELRRVIDTNAPLWGFTADLVGYGIHRARHPFAKPEHPTSRDTFDLGLSILPSRFPESFWAEGEPMIAVVLLHPRVPTDPYVQLALVRGGVSVGLWDEVGLVDADVFAAAMRAGLAR